jgi:arylsulfatase A-like enzyme
MVVRRFISLVLGILIPYLACLVESRAVDRPNIVFILADDVRWDDLGCTGHPFSQTPHLDRLAREGMLFRQAFATTPLCSPSRASFLTGLYPHQHGITDNTDRSPTSHRLATFPQHFKQHGYETAFIGKWHMGNDDSRRPGFDHWVCLKGQGSSWDPELNVNGSPEKTSGHVTDVLAEQALAFLKRPHPQPFLLYLAHKAVHPETVQLADGSLSDPQASNFVPAERHAQLYEGQTVPRRPNAQAPRGKPILQRPLPGLPPLGPETGSSDEAILGRLRMLAGIDDSVGLLLDALRATGVLDDTVVVFTSDHGYFYGEHGLSVERRFAYEEAIRIPLWVRYPPRVPPGSTCEQMVLSIDLAPTLGDLAGLPAQPGLHGRSFVPLFSEPNRQFRDAFLIEHYSDQVFPRAAGCGYQAVRTPSWKWIHYVDVVGMDELYHLEQDPLEMRNLIADPQAQEALARIRDEWRRLLGETQAPARPSLPASN